MFYFLSILFDYKKHNMINLKESFNLYFFENLKYKNVRKDILSKELLNLNKETYETIFVDFSFEKIANKKEFDFSYLLNDLFSLIEDDKELILKNFYFIENWTSIKIKLKNNLENKISLIDMKKEILNSLYNKFNDTLISNQFDKMNNIFIEIWLHHYLSSREFQNLWWDWYTSFETENVQLDFFYNVLKLNQNYLNHIILLEIENLNEKIKNLKEYYNSNYKKEDFKSIKEVEFELKALLYKLDKNKIYNIKPLQKWNLSLPEDALSWYEEHFDYLYNEKFSYKEIKEFLEDNILFEKQYLKKLLSETNLNICSPVIELLSEIKKIDLDDMIWKNLYKKDEIKSLKSEMNYFETNKDAKYFHPKPEDSAWAGYYLVNDITYKDYLEVFKEIFMEYIQNKFKVDKSKLKIKTKVLYC